MKRSPFAVAPLMLGSGFCALVYQTVWMRQFRLIFGASTLATAAVLAIFMAGLGLGSALLGVARTTIPIRCSSTETSSC
jgi:spermidine synthase